MSNLAPPKPKSELAAKADAVTALITKVRPAIEKSVPRHVTASRIMRIAQTALRNRDIAACTEQSLMTGIVSASVLGLELNTPLGLASLIPFRNKGRMEATLIVEYRGMMQLARRSGEIKTLYAETVHENDQFEYAYGSGGYLKHKPALANRGNAYAYYAYCALKDGGEQWVVLSREDVDKYRNRSRAKDNGPWVSDYDAMAKKTCIRRLCTFLPMATDLREAEDIEDRQERGLPPAWAEAIDTETGEIIDADADELEGEMQDAADKFEDERAKGD